jgi:hypothetical protein
VFQPADVGLQRIIKHRLRQETLEFMVRQMSDQMNNGLTPEQVQLATKIGPLCDASVGAIERVYDWLASPQSREIVKRAWEKCKVFKWNLGSLDYRLLRDCGAVDALIDYLGSPKGSKVHDEILKKIGNVYGIEEEVVLDDESSSQWDDHTDVPMRVLVRKTLDLDLPEGAEEGQLFCVAANEVAEDSNQDFEAAGRDEDVWAHDYDAADAGDDDDAS